VNSNEAKSPEVDIYRLNSMLHALNQIPEFHMDIPRINRRSHRTSAFGTLRFR
jgi:hypothetical protein